MLSLNGRIPQTKTLIMFAGQTPSEPSENWDQQGGQQVSAVVGHLGVLEPPSGKASGSHFS